MGFSTVLGRDFARLLSFEGFVVKRHSRKNDTFVTIVLFDLIKAVFKRTFFLISGFIMFGKNESQNVHYNS